MRHFGRVRPLSFILSDGLRTSPLATPLRPSSDPKMRSFQTTSDLLESGLDPPYLRENLCNSGIHLSRDITGDAVMQKGTAPYLFAGHGPITFSMG